MTFRTPFRTPVRGHAFAAAPAGARPRPGQPGRLVREPANPADELAVAVWVDEGERSWRVGYLDRAVAARIAPRLDAGARLAASLEGWVAEPEGRWHRPLVLVRPEPGEPIPGGHAPDDSGGPSASHAGGRRLAAEAAAGYATDGLWGLLPGVARRTVFGRAGRQAPSSPAAGGSVGGPSAGGPSVG